MSEFAGEGFTPFLNTEADAYQMKSVSEWPDARIEDKVLEYWEFLERKDLMPRAVKAAHRILEHLGFEMDARYGAYDYVLEGKGYLDGTATE